MLRRQARLRREFIYKKSIEERDRVIESKKKSVKHAYESHTNLPEDVRDDALKLYEKLQFDDEGGDGVVSQQDNEYRWAGVEDPKIVVSTSRDPSAKLKQFAKEVKLMFPNSQRVNRGKYDIGELVDACRANDVTDIIILSEHRGVPTGMVVSHQPHGPTAYFNISNCILRHDIPNVGTMSEQYPHLIFENFKSRIGHRIEDVLRYLFPVPREESRRVMCFANNSDYIHYRHYVYQKMHNGKEIEVKEVGPRFELLCYRILLGSIEEENSADIQWDLRSYTNTAYKKLILSNEPLLDFKDEESDMPNNV